MGRRYFFLPVASTDFPMMKKVMSIRTTATGRVRNMYGSCSEAMITCWSEVSQIGARMKPMIRQMKD